MQAVELAYEDESTIRAGTGEWGFDRFRFFPTGHEEPSPPEDTQAHAPLAPAGDGLRDHFMSSYPEAVEKHLT